APGSSPWFFLVGHFTKCPPCFVAVCSQNCISNFSVETGEIRSVSPFPTLNSRSARVISINRRKDRSVFPCLNTIRNYGFTCDGQLPTLVVVHELLKSKSAHRGWTQGRDKVGRQIVRLLTRVITINPGCSWSGSACPHDSLLVHRPQYLNTEKLRQ